MMIVAIFVAKLLSPIAAVLGLAADALSNTWWQLAIAALIIAGIHEVVLSSMQITRTFNIWTFAIGVAAAGAWVLAGFSLRWLWLRLRRH